MRCTRLTTTELRNGTGNPPRYSHARRRLIAAVFGILALLTQAGFTLGAAAAVTTALPGSLTADLAKLCLGAFGDTGGDWSDTQPGNALDCGHCTLCAVATAGCLPATGPETPDRITAALHSPIRLDPAPRHGFTRFRNPRAPPL